MSAPNVDLEQEEAPDTTQDIDTTSEGGNIETQNQAPAIDFQALYRESLAERRRQEEELERLRGERNKPAQSQDEDITDDYFEKHGTAKGVAAIVETKVAKLLQQSLGDIGELSQDFKRGKQIASAEEKFYQEFPQLLGWKDQLSSSVRGFLSNAPNVDIGTYRQVALSTIGALTVQNLNAQPQKPNTPQSPSVPSAPTQRTNTQTKAPIRKMSEFERSAMKRAGYDPNKREDVDAFWAIVDGEEGVTV